MKKCKCKQTKKTQQNGIHPVWRVLKRRTVLRWKEHLRWFSSKLQFMTKCNILNIATAKFHILYTVNLPPKSVNFQETLHVLSHIPTRFPSQCVCLLPSAGETKATSLQYWDPSHLLSAHTSTLLHDSHTYIHHRWASAPALAIMIPLTHIGAHHSTAQHRFAAQGS